MKKKFLFGCKCVFEHKAKPPGGKAGHRFYEEQIFIVRAINPKEARKLALKLAKTKEHRDKKGATDVTLLGLIGIYFTLDQELQDGAEIFCSFRESKLKPKQYISQHFKSIHDYEVGCD